MPTFAALALAAAVAGAAPAAEGLPPRVRNADVKRHDASQGLDAVFRGLAAQPGPLWIGYAVPMFGQHQMCCYESVGAVGKGCPGCRLEGDGAFMTGGTAVDLEGDRTFLALFRVEGGRLDRVRPLSWSCGLDAGGKPLHWLDGVSAQDSLRLLASLAEGNAVPRKRHGDWGEGILSLVAFHDHPDADVLLERWAAPGQERGRRRQAAFWMGNARGRRGYEALRKLVQDDKDPDFREHVVFALSQSDVPEAIDVMLDVARRDAEPEVRGKALFWLGQKAGSKAVDGITRAMDDDPDTEVKRKAVFALSQLPKDEGVPLLIQTARKHRNPEVRKQAMFWLGQTGDPRALAFFAEILR
jgi:hypothetical protein